jgi:hypothetical protein
MAQRWQRIEIAVLGGGSLFAWVTVLADFRRFFQAGGTLGRFSGTTYPHPALTPCFYGAILFLVALTWAVTLAPEPAEGRRRGVRQLVGMLVLGTVFAWGNFAWELYRWCQPHEGPYLSCSGTVAAHPVSTPCFVGALIYLTALAVAVAGARRGRAVEASPA